MKAQFVRELAEGARVDAVFALSTREMRSTRTGEAYLALELSDRSGRIPAVLFRPSAQESAVPTHSVVRVTGIVTVYRGRKRVSVEHMAVASRYEVTDLLPGPKRERAETQAEFKGLVRSVRDRDLGRVLRAVFGDTQFLERFSTCPGAQTYHHAYVGGLLEHTVAVASICRHLAALYDEVDRDMLVTAALLHDIGKTDELQFRTSIEYTDEGRLLGHVVLGERRMREAVARKCPGVSPRTLTRLSHALLSHHGELEWGSPKRPSTVEALALHHADNMDAKAAGFIALLPHASSVEERWTDADNLFRRPLSVPTPADADRPSPAREDDEYLLAMA
ncbi:MAG: HD domain-containing protein [Actinomycetota bacterium]|nr:HD domain-containing protein [Actinomycetota bacterium]